MPPSPVVAEEQEKLIILLLLSFSSSKWLPVIEGVTKVLVSLAGSSKSSASLWVPKWLSSFLVNSNPLGLGPSTVFMLERELEKPPFLRILTPVKPAKDTGLDVKEDLVDITLPSASVPKVSIFNSSLESVYMLSFVFFIRQYSLVGSRVTTAS